MATAPPSASTRRRPSKDAFHAAGVANGGTTCENSPGWRDGSVGKLYLAYVRDPDGNKLCAPYRPP
jgi:catechol 2,3-dioxygenase-like lactoylglutathione lyase family enzyme